MGRYPGAEDAEPVILIPVGLPCLERGRPYKKKYWGGFVDLLLLNVPCIFLRTHLQVRQPCGLAHFYVRMFMYGKADWLRCISQSSIEREQRNTTSFIFLTRRALF